jgi:hypothetical protein
MLPAASVLLGLTFVATSSEAQQTRYGAFLGTSIASIQQESGFSPETSRRIGVQGGLWMNKPINNRLSFQPEVHYTQKGVRYEQEGTNGGEFFDAELRLSLSYLEVQLLLNVNLSSESASSVRPFLLAGPAFALKTDCSIGISADGLNINVPCEGSELGDETTSDVGVKSFDLGAMLGGGLGFRIGSREATIGLRYTQGLISIAKEAEGSVKNNNFSVLFGISF